jgi:excinuclease ABC subunit B
MKTAIEETNRRRAIQADYNRVHGITPTGVKKGIPDLEYAVANLDYVQLDLAAEAVGQYGMAEGTDQLIDRLEAEMKVAAKELAFERAAELRNQIRALRLQALDMKF